MKTSTCRYMRFKMNIDTESPNCIYCTSQLESLEHIFLECTKTTILVSNIENFILEKISSDYHDTNKIYYITCSHENSIINYIWASFKLYLSRCFQKFKEPTLIGYINFTKVILIGENQNTIMEVKRTLGIID